MIKYNKVLDFGLADLVDKRLLIIRELAISGTKEDIDILLKHLVFFKHDIKNYNIKDVTNKDYDYFMWRSIDEDYVTLTYNSYKSVVSCIELMKVLITRIKWLENVTLNVTIKYNTIDSLVDKVKENINFENSLKEGKENE